MIYQRVSDGKSFKVMGSGNSTILAEMDNDHTTVVEGGEEIDISTVDVRDKTEWREMH